MYELSSYVSANMAKMWDDKVHAKVLQMSLDALDRCIIEMFILPAVKSDATCDIDGYKLSYRQIYDGCLQEEKKRLGLKLFSGASDELIDCISDSCLGAGSHSHYIIHLKAIVIPVALLEAAKVNADMKWVELSSRYPVTVQRR